MLQLDSSDEVAAENFGYELVASIGDQWRRFDNAAHLAKHRG